MTTEELLNWKEKIQEAQLLLGKAEAKLEENCFHPKEHVTTEDWSDGGSYYDRCIYYRTLKCTICGTQDTVKTGTGGYG